MILLSSSRAVVSVARKRLGEVQIETGDLTAVEVVLVHVRIDIGCLGFLVVSLHNVKDFFSYSNKVLCWLRQSI